MTETRTRAAPKADEKVVVKLVRGRQYSLHRNGKWLVFARGRPVRVPRGVAEHLAASAIDLSGYRDPERGQVTRLVRKFEIEGFEALAAEGTRAELQADPVWAAFLASFKTDSGREMHLPAEYD